MCKYRLKVVFSLTPQKKKNNITIRVINNAIFIFNKLKHIWCARNEKIIIKNHRYNNLYSRL